MAFTWLTYATGRQQLAQRLADPSRFWSDAELGLYVQEALRTWNALTFSWKIPFSFSIAAASTPTWFSLATLSGSSRLRTLTDVALYTVMQYHLLEPASGGTWSGTSQFSIADLSLALQRCRDEMIQVTNCNLANPYPLQTTPNIRTVPLPDTFLDVSRARYIGSDNSVSTLARNDETGLGFYQPDYLQSPAGTPTQYNVASLPPLTMELDIAPAIEGAADIIALLAGSALTPPTPSLLSVPDDFAWVLKWGALADLLSRESEATDQVRAAWCKKRYMEGIALMQNTPWVMSARINEVTAELVGLSEMDNYSPEWDSAGPDYQSVVLAGMDFLTVVPDPNALMSVTLTTLGNAPVPAADADFIQVSRENWDAILDYAQFLATWKYGGAEFIAAQELDKRFMQAAKVTNDRLAKLGLFADVYEDQGQRDEREQERFSRQ